MPDFDPLFNDVTPLTPDEALAAANAAEAASDGTEPFVLRTAELRPIGRSWRFDFDKRRFVSVNRGTPQAIYGEATLRQWVNKALVTQRGGSLIHTSLYGMEDPFLAIGGPSHPALIADIQTMVEEALIVHPRIKGIEDFKVGTEPEWDYIELSFTVRTDTDETLRLDAVTLER